MARVSVIIPSYNHGKYISEAIESVLNQSYQDFEIVITDDGSTDNSVDVIKSFRDNRIKIFVFGFNIGACSAANNCIKHSSGEYIAMLSSDDVFLPDKLAKQVEFLDNNDRIGVVFGLPVMIDEYGKHCKNDMNNVCENIFKKKNRDRYKWLNYFFNQGNCLCHPSAMIRRKCYDTVGLYDQRFASLPDLDFWVRLCRFYDIFIMQEKLIKMRWMCDDTNESGFNLPNITRCTWEYKMILEHYLNLTADEFNKIFPDQPVNYKRNEREILLFSLAQLAIKNINRPHKMFAMDLYYKLMGDKEMVALLNSKYNFHYKDLINLSGQNNIFIPQIHLESTRELFKLTAKQACKSIKNRLSR